MPVVDELEIELTADVKKANTSIDNLVDKLDMLSGSLSKIDGSRLSGLANGVGKLGYATKALSGTKATDYTRIANGFGKLAKIDASKFSDLSSGLNLLARGMTAIGSIQNMENITPFINAIKNLARVDMSGFDASKLEKIAGTMSSFATQMSGAGKIEGSVTRLVSAMARLSSSGQYIENVVTYFPQLGDKVVLLVGELSSAGAIDTNIAKLVDGIARLASAGKRIEVTVANLDKLGDGVVRLMKKIQSAPQVNANVANTIQGLGNLAVSGSRISTVAGNAAGSTKRFGNALTLLRDKLKGANKSSKGLASSIGMFYAKMFIVIRAVKKFGEAIGSAQDYIEEFNYFSVALDKIGKDSAKQFKKAGYSSAEEYAKSFRSRFSKLQTQLTGYRVDYDTGDATSQMTHNLGLDLTKVMNFNAAIAQITNSAGMLGETSIMTSKALSMLSADWSSLSNQDLSDVMNNMQSALVGQSRAVYKYGIDITSAGLAQTALNHGIKVNIMDLSQQSKMQLRALTMLEQSKVAYGDLARTINQPANQLRMLEAGFKNLIRTIGSLFMPIMQKLYPYLNAVVMVLQDFAQWIAKAAGIKLGDVDGGISTPDYSDAVDDSADIADNMDDASKKAKKTSDNLQGFDIVNKLQGNEDSDTGTTSSGNENLDLSKELSNALANYGKMWDNAFKGNQNKAVQLANKIKKALIDGWKKGGDYTDVGKAFGNWINKGLSGIKWDKIKKTSNKVASSVATFLNGAISGLDWKLVGDTIGESINTAFGAAYTFITKFNWLAFGTNISSAINSAVKKTSFTLIGKTLGAKLRGTIQFAFGILANLNYTEMGEKLGDAINGFLEDMGKIDNRTGLTGWQELGKTISDSIKGILDTIDTALSTVNWMEIGKAIGDFLGEIDWFGILGRVGKVIAKSLFSALKVAISALINDPIGVAGTIITVLGSYFAYKKLKSLIAPLKGNIGTVLSIAIKESSIGSASIALAKTFGRTFIKVIGQTKIAQAVVGALSSVTGKMSALATKIGTALFTKLNTLFSSTAFVGKFALGAALVTVIAAETYILIDKLKDLIDAYYQTDLKTYTTALTQQQIDSVEEKMKGLKTAAKDTKDVLSSFKTKMNEATSVSNIDIEKLADSYYKLSQKTNPTTSDIAVMKKYSEELSAIIPGFSKNVDEQTGAFKGSKNALDSLTGSYKRTLKAQVAYEQSVELYQQKEENEKQIKKKDKILKEAEENYKNAFKHLQELYKQGYTLDDYIVKNQLKQVADLANVYNKARFDVDDLKKEQKKLNSQIKKNNNIMGNAEVSTKQYESATKKLKNSLSNFGIKGKEQKTILKNLL